MPLSDISVRNAKPQQKPAKLFDGGGLFLFIAPTGGKMWRLKYRFQGKEKLLALGVYPDVGLKEARKRRDEAREQLAMGNDPGEVKKEIRATARAAEKERQNTFEVAAREWFASYSPALTPKHAAKLQRYLDTILFPRLGNKSVTDLEPSDFLGVTPARFSKHTDVYHWAQGQTPYQFSVPPAGWQYSCFPKRITAAGH